MDLFDKGGNLLMEHGSNDAHYGGIIVVELDDTREEHSLLVEVVRGKGNAALEGVVHRLVLVSFEIFV